MDFASRYFPRFLKDLRISPFACLLWCLILLALPLRWITAALVSIGVHELCHSAAVTLCGGSVRGVSLGAGGIRLETEGLTPGKEMVCALAGPFGGLLLFFFCRSMPRLALCALFHSGCNLLPVYPLDGGRALHSLVLLIFPQKGEHIFAGMQRIFLGALMGVCLWASFIKGLGWMPLVIAGYFLIKVKRTEKGIKSS